jgi:hypothetical protein
MSPGLALLKVRQIIIITHAHESEQFASLLNRIELKNAAEDKW